MKINRQRLASTFMDMVRIDSPSREEREIAQWIRDKFERLPGCRAEFDSSSEQTGSQCGNLLIRIDGEKDAPSLFFNAHMDTVEPGRGIKPVFDGNIFRTDGSTILGSDDKAAIAIMLEVISCLRESGEPHGPLEIILTVCEEIGLLGAKALDPSMITARAGYALDTTDTDVLINSAPEAVRLSIDIIGQSAHAGINPEDGINAIQIAARALASVPLGRIDHETTANIGIIHGGKATNIVPDLVHVEGEVRSHSPETLRRVQDQITGSFVKTARAYSKDAQGSGIENRPPAPPFVQTEVINDYPAMNLSSEHILARTAIKAAKADGRNLRIQSTGGGSDANILNSKGLDTVILGVGMQNVHTTGEFILLDDMIKSARLMYGIIQEWSCLKIGSTDE